MKLFDAYDMKARLSVVIILCSPLLLALFLQVDVFRSLATTTLVAVAFYALANILMIYVRKSGLKMQGKRQFVARCLYDTAANVVEEEIIVRFFQYLVTLDKGYDILIQQRGCGDVGQEYKDACYGALNWLKENVRDSELIGKENAMYGFCRNLNACRNTGVALNLLLLFAQSTRMYMHYLASGGLDEIQAIVFAIELLYLVLWVFGVNEELMAFTERKYAEALLRSVDKFIQPPAIR